MDLVSDETTGLTSSPLSSVSPAVRSLLRPRIGPTLPTAFWGMGNTMAALLATLDAAAAAGDALAPPAAADDAVEATELSLFCSRLIFCLRLGRGGLLKWGSMHA